MKIKEHSLLYYLPIAGVARIIGFILFTRVLAICEIQIVFFRIWTRVTKYIPYDDSNYFSSATFWWGAIKFGLDLDSTEEKDLT